MGSRITNFRANRMYLILKFRLLNMRERQPKGNGNEADRQRFRKWRKNRKKKRLLKSSKRKNSHKKKRKKHNLKPKKSTKNQNRNLKRNGNETKRVVKTIAMNTRILLKKRKRRK